MRQLVDTSVDGLELGGSSPVSIISLDSDINGVRLAGAGADTVDADSCITTDGLVELSMSPTLGDMLGYPNDQLRIRYRTSSVDRMMPRE